MFYCISQAFMFPFQANQSDRLDEGFLNYAVTERTPAYSIRDIIDSRCCQGQMKYLIK